MAHNADEFEHALRNSAQGEQVEGQLAPLVWTADLVRRQLQTPPPPPRGLVPGRQLLLAEAARLREERAVRRQASLALRLATAMALLLLLSGAFLGAQWASAASLPGDPIYGAKLAVERIRLALTVRPQNRSALLEATAGRRIDEVLSLLRQGRALDSSVSGRATRQLQQALEAAAWLEDSWALPALQKLAETIRQREEAILGAAGDSPGPAVQALLREMERVREEAQLGQGDPEGLRERLRRGVAPQPTEPPGATPTPNPSATGTPTRSSPTGRPGLPATPHRTGLPTELPEPSGTPWSTPTMSATPEPTGGTLATHTSQPSVTLEPTGGPYPLQTPGPTTTPEPSHGTVTPAPGSTGAPTPHPGHTAAPTTHPGGTAGPTTRPDGAPAQTPEGGGREYKP